MIYLVTKVLKSGDLLMYFCSDTLSTANACLIVPNSHRFIGCEMGTECVKLSESYMVKKFTPQLLNTQPNLIADEKLFAVAKTFKTTLYYINSKKTKDSWLAHPGLHLIKLFQTSFCTIWKQ